MATNPANFSEFSPDNYLAFDATSFRDLAIRKLTNAQSPVFTDQIFQGSNLNAIIEFISFSFSLMSFTLNRTASESQFSNAQIYENMNKIVQLLNYSPTGYSTSILSFQSATSLLGIGVYTIPRFSYFMVNNNQYTFVNDATFTVPVTGQQNLTQLSNNNVLYQGTYVEYPQYTAIGEDYETVKLILVNPNNGANIFIDHFSMKVFVKSLATNTWSEYTATNNLYLENSNASVYQLKFTENGRYAFTFGNNINGKALNAGDIVQIFYLQSNGPTAQISTGVLNGNPLFYYDSPVYTEILNDITPSNLTYMDVNQANLITFTNNSPSTPFGYPEDVDSIRANAPNTFKSQYRIVTTSDAETYIKKNFSNFIIDSACVNNTEYLNGMMKYYYGLGLTRPSLDSRVLSNQVQFSTGTDFNQMYIIAVPKVSNQTNSLMNNNYLTTSQKQLIYDTLSPIKCATSELSIIDPVYIAIGAGVKLPTDTELDYLTILGSTSIVVNRDPDSRINTIQIQTQINNILNNYFSALNCQLGMTIDLVNLNNQILNTPGVQSFSTQRIDSNGNVYSVNGLSLLLFNPVYYVEDIQISSQNVKLDYFKFPYLYNGNNLINNIKVVNNNVNSI